jgi:peptidoglycan hydrolase-like protein with peptidoglycan-binding domain
MPKTKILTGAGIVAAVLVVARVVLSGGNDQDGTAQAAPVTTGTVEQGSLSAAVSQDGLLMYRARRDGSPLPAINNARGTYTELPEAGSKVDCGGVLYRVNQKPVILLCGAVPAYRALHQGDGGQDVRQLNRNLHQLGYDAKARVRIDPADTDFTEQTERALKVLQRKKGLRATGTLERADAVFLPESVRIAKVTGQLGGAAQQGAPVLNATFGTLHVQVNLDPSEQGQVKRGDRAHITLPGNTTVAGTVAGFGRIAQAPAGQDSAAADATIPTYISLDDPRKASGLDRAPVQVEITTEGVGHALSVPVTALVGKAGGGYAVEVVRAGGRREPVAVELGLFGTADGRVQIEGGLRAGDRVVVPSL